MPKFSTSNEIQSNIPGKGGFQYSAVAPEKLQATEYTLVSVVIDVTGSVDAFASELLDCLKRIVEACQRSPRRDNLLLRVTTFNTRVQEVHGFMLLADINPEDYDPFHTGGMTALFDATGTAIDATLGYAQTLTNQDYDVNGIVIVITDGADNSSSNRTPADIANSIKAAKQQEDLESLLSIVVGLHDPDLTGNDWASAVKSALDEFVKEGDIDQFVNAGSATPQKIAKLADFVSQSVSSQSQALGTGGASQPLTF